MNDPTGFLNDMFRAALAAADPAKVLPSFLPDLPKGRLVIVGAGKAAASMAQAVETHWPDEHLQGLVVTQRGAALPTRSIEIIQSSHPVPDDAGELAARRMLDMVAGLGPDDVVLNLISGGGSSLLSLPVPGISSAEKRQIHYLLVKSGAPIHRINCVRKHLSAIKGGRLAAAAYPAPILNLVISDVPGDDPHVVASGPGLPDHTTQDNALKILESYNIPFSDAVRAWLTNPANETPKPDNPRLSRSAARVISCNRDALQAAADFVTSQGITPIILGDAIEGEARVVGAEHAALALQSLDRGPCVLLSGGETTVTVRGNGMGGRNSEYLLACAMKCAGHLRIYGLAAGTDGKDGRGDNAGVVFTPQTLSAARAKNMDAAAYLDNNDTYNFFAPLDQLVMTGPTYTNVNDIRGILIL